MGFSWRMAPALLLVSILGILGVERSLQKGREDWTPPPTFRLNRWKPLHVREGEPRVIPWVHRDFELTGRVVVPRGRHMDLVFHLERGPFPRSKADDRTLPQGPLDWSALRLSAGDMGEPFLSSRRLPAGTGGWRVPPGLPVDVHLRLRDGTARVEVGHRALPGPWKVRTREGILALVGEGTWERLTLKALDRTLSPWKGRLQALLLWLLGALALGWAWKLASLPGVPLAGGVLLASLAGWGGFLLSPLPPSKAAWNPAEAPSFQEAVRLYGEAEGFRNWGAYAGSLFWRGRKETRRPFEPCRRILFLGGPQVWGRGVPLKDGTLPMQVEGILEGRRKAGSPHVHVMVGACRETDLERQVEIFEREFLSYHPDAVVLVVPRGTKGKALERGLDSFFRLARKVGLPFLLLPPLQAGGGSLPIPSLASKAREAGGRFWSPGDLLRRKEIFLSRGDGPARPGDLSPSGHLSLAEPLARVLQELTRF